MGINNNYINTHHNNTSHSTNQNTNQQPSTCLYQTLTHQMRASLARSPTPPTTSPRPSRATLLRPARRPTRNRQRAMLVTPPLAVVLLVLSVLRPTSSTRPSTRVLARPTRRLSKFLTLHTSPTTIIRRMHDGMELNAGPMATCDHINGVA